VTLQTTDRGRALATAAVGTDQRTVAKVVRAVLVGWRCGSFGAGRQLMLRDSGEGFLANPELIDRTKS
jgi:hypothetical protein